MSTADTLRVVREGRVSLEVSASDEDDDPLGYHWSALGAGSFTDTAANITVWTAPDRIEGASEFFLVTVTITDHQPDTEDIVESFAVEVIQRRPSLIAPADTAISFRESQLVLEATGSDEDGDRLTFNWEILEGERVTLDVRQPETGRSQATIASLVPTDLRLLLSLTDEADTLFQEILIAIEASEMPETGTVTLQRPVDDGGEVSYEMDVYEYPNQRGELPRHAASWFEANSLCAARGMRLCSSAEWLNACQGPQILEYSSSDDPATLPAAFGLRFCNTEGSDIAGESPDFSAVGPSGSFPNCTSPETGVYDLTGNAFEWVMDVETIGDTLGQRVGGFQQSGAFSAPCNSFRQMPALPPAADLDLGDPAVVDSLLSESNFAGYGQSSFGFRCCR
ncbi:MAG: SUMF1/EgtB/PvdO family nonheme iron enzyme [Gemmatimonadetes bacterium]|nr:SUMF1/EgtB/PvdO family nonheme iron enzyme [Gemmatimonadota bacterium]MBT6148988.1 SUMF1/EgtB/PvdO family nonheme iron enzyme [Gemmatimonadota bacterium]MBT7859753.1 SUMF1/EgtB/PvdO family nonheme iron enzyme [Gemmatimonadota bacterium]